MSSQRSWFSLIEPDAVARPIPKLEEPRGELVDRPEELAVGQARESARRVAHRGGAIRPMGAARAQMLDDAAGHRESVIASARAARLRDPI